MALKINPLKYIKIKFPGSNWSVILMGIKQSEVYDKVLVTEFCVFLTRRGPQRIFDFLTHTNWAYHRLSLGRI